jgi:arylsulfatase A-like enzyme/cytochrome c-type biogenesis protein CcmH/NrfG
MPMASSSRAPARRFRRLQAAALLALPVLLLLALLFGPSLQRWRLQRRLRGCNVILLTLDTLRADHLGCYGSARARTPGLDSLAAQGTLFERCIAQVPLTLPSHTTILSGTYPAFHRVRDNGGFVVPEKLELLSESLAARGFATAAFVSAYVLHSKWGLKQGWEHYADSFRYSKVKSLSLSNIQKTAGEVLAEAEDWLAANGGRRFFAWVHLYDPHAPYEPPPEFAARYPNDPYSGEVAYMDAELAKFFAFLRQRGLWENTLIVATADHGEMLGEHGEDGHGFFVYEGAVHVPLIVRAPWRLGRRRVATTVEHVDIVPTVREALGLPARAALPGRSLLGLARGEVGSRRSRALSETWYPRLHYGWSELTALYQDGYKYIAAPREELYQAAGGAVAEDEDLSRQRSAVARRMRAALRADLDRVGRNPLSPSGGGELSREDREKLAALGYLSTVVSGSAESLAIDPKAKIGVFNDLMRARALQDAGRAAEAIALVRAILERDPEIIDGRMLLGNLYFKEQRYAEALETYREVIRRKPDYNFAMLNVVNSLMSLRLYEQAERELLAFRAVFPRDATFLQLLGQVAAQRQRLDEALDLFRQALAMDPKYAEPWVKMGEIHFQRREMERAEECFARAQEINPELARGAFTRALAAEARGDWQRARDSYLRELEYNPTNFKAAFNLAQACRKLGRMDEALRFFRRTIELNPGFNLPYFLVAKFDFEERRDLRAAIDLCRRGVAIQPADRNTAHGYFLLADLYAALGDGERARASRRLGERARALATSAPR